MDRMRDVEEVVREIMRDERFKGHQNFTFEASLQDDGERVYGGEANAVGLLPRLSQVIPGYHSLSLT